MSIIIRTTRIAAWLAAHDHEIYTSSIWVSSVQLMLLFCCVGVEVGLILGSGGRVVCDFYYWRYFDIRSYFTDFFVYKN